MKRSVVLAAYWLIAFVTVTAGWVFIFRSTPHVSGPLRHEVYVWQRAWTEPVRNAVEQHGTNFSALAVLKAEVSWKDKKPQVTRVAVDYATLAKTHRPVGIALRIGPYAGPFAAPSDFGLRGQAKRDPALASAAQGTNVSKAPSSLRSAGAVQDAPGEAITSFLCDLAASLVAQARTNHVNLSELQIDFDCAESKLDGYRVWVEAIQQRVAPLPVTITALPSWLDSARVQAPRRRGDELRAASPLGRAAQEFRRAVHAVRSARGAPGGRARRAHRRSVSRRVADLWLHAGVRRGRQVHRAFRRRAASELAHECADSRGCSPTRLNSPRWCASWTASRPAAMRGVIWYRLPTIVDNFNWRWPTLGAILDARIPREVLRVNTRRVESGLVEISLANEGELDISSRLAVEVRWSRCPSRGG